MMDVEIVIINVQEFVIYFARHIACSCLLAFKLLIRLVPVFTFDYCTHALMLCFI